MQLSNVFEKCLSGRYDFVLEIRNGAVKMLHKEYDYKNSDNMMMLANKRKILGIS